VDTQLRNEVVMLRIVPALSAAAVSQARDLFREYSATPGVVPCLADFERELASLPGPYAAPGGRLLLAFDEGAEGLGEAVGCVAARGLEPGVCEMKRLYVRPAFRGNGAGRHLVEKLIADARSIGYKRMVLDTLPSMAEAHKLYRTLGFLEIPPYQKDPIPGALFLELVLQ
jgi:ribosomal protein S18 acetylase RimI-like enzyme